MADSALSTTRSVVAGSTSPAAPSSRRRLAHARHEVARGVDQPGQDQVAQRVAGQLALVEAALEGRGQRGVLVGQGHQALADVARGPPR